MGFFASSPFGRAGPRRPSFPGVPQSTNTVRATLEARCGARDGEHVIIAIWGRLADLEFAALMAGLRSLLRSLPAGAARPISLSEGGAWEGLLGRRS